MLSPQDLRIGFITVVVALVLGSRFTKGRATQTADGVVFRLKLVTRISMVLVPAYILLTWWALRTQGHPQPWWATVLFIVAIVFILIRMPGTITLTPTAVTQRFWLLPSKQIAYEDVMAIQSVRGGSITRVMGNTRVNIVHTQGHSAADEFRAEMEKRTGKQVVI